MNEIDSNIWEVYDPDKILNLSVDQIISIESVHFKENQIYPREDLIQLTNKSNGNTIDLGFYEEEASLEGKWIIYVVDSKNDWDCPIERVEHSNLLSAIQSLREKTLVYR